MKISRIVYAFCLLCFALGGPALAQDKSEKNKKDEKKPVEIKTNLLALDADNKLVGDLKPDDVKLFEDGVEQRITALTKKETVLNLGIVLDNTGSLRMELDTIIAAARNLTANLREGDEAFVVRFVSSDKITLLRDWTADKRLLARALDESFIEGGASAVVDGLYFATEHLLKRAAEKETPRRALVLISDCEDRDSVHRIEEVYKKLEGSGIQIFVVAMTQGIPQPATFGGDSGKTPKERAESFAGRLAWRTGGTAYFPGAGKSKKPLAEIMKSLVLELRSQYVVEYASTNPERGKKPRKLTVRIADGANGEKRTGFVREEFIVPKD